jgi:hypothetical protein
VITQELLDKLWDFGDPAASERRFAAEAASQEHSDAERAELLTQQARAQREWAREAVDECAAAPRARDAQVS